MTISSITSKSGPYNWDGTAAGFAYTFRIIEVSHLRVMYTDADGAEHLLVLDDHYTVDGTGVDGGGNISMVADASRLGKITILRNPPFTQETDLQNQGAFHAQSVEDRFDILTMQSQSLREEVERSVKIPVSDQTTTLDTLTTDIIRIAGSADNVEIVAGAIADVQTAASNIADINAASTHATNAANSASSASVSQTSATSSSAAAAGSKTQAATSASNAASSASDALASQTAATLSASSATTSEANAASSLSGAISSASSSLTAQTASETAQAGSVAARDIAVSAKDEAVTRADEVAAVGYRYLGAKIANPATRNDGSILGAGDLYFNTSDQTMRVFDGDWTVATTQPLDIISHQFSGDGAVTVFILSSNAGIAANLLVEVSGVIQHSDAYTVSGSTLTFLSAPPTGENNIEVRIFATTSELQIPAIGSVTPNTIAPDAITSIAIAANAITAAKMAPGAVGTVSLIDAAVNATKMDGTDAAAIRALIGAITVADVPDSAPKNQGFIGVQMFQNSGTYTKPALVNKVLVFVAGGSGGGNASVTISASYGGTSSFGSHVSASGGSGGSKVLATTTTWRANDGTGVGGDINTTLLTGGAGGALWQSSIWRLGQPGGLGGLGIKFISSGIGATETITVGRAGPRASGGNEPGAAGKKGFVLVLEMA